MGSKILFGPVFINIVTGQAFFTVYGGSAPAQIVTKIPENCNQRSRRFFGGGLAGGEIIRRVTFSCHAVAKYGQEVDLGIEIGLGTSLFRDCVTWKARKGNLNRAGELRAGGEKGGREQNYGLILIGTMHGLYFKSLVCISASGLLYPCGCTKAGFTDMDLIMK